MPAVNFSNGTNVSIAINKGPLTGGVPGGSNSTIQYNDNGLFSGIANVTTDGNSIITSNTNIKITGGTSNQILKTDGTGNLSWTTFSPTPGGNNTQLQYNNNGSLSGINGVTSDGNTLYISDPGKLLIGGGSALATLVAGGPGGPDSLTWGPSILEIVTTSVNTALSEVPPPAGANNSVQIKSGNVFVGSSEFSYSNDTVVIGNINPGILNIGTGETTLSPLQIFATPSSAGIFAPDGTGVGAANLLLTGGSSNSSSGGSVIITGGAGTPNGNVELITQNGNLKLTDTGAISVNGSTGNIGQVLTSNGANGAYWAASSGSSNLYTVLNTGNTSNIGITLTNSAVYTGLATGLSNIPGANVTGTVANANVSNNVIVDVANVSTNYNILLSSVASGATSLRTDTDFAYNPITNTLTVGNLLSVDSLGLDTANTGTAGVAKFTWDDGVGTSVLGLKGGVVSIPLGQTEVQLCYNSTASTMTLGKVVKIAGAQGNRISVALAQSNVEGTSTQTFGFVNESIATGVEGFIITSGLLTKLDTTVDSEGNTLLQGDQLYLSATVAGGYTKVRPSAPNHTVVLGFVVRVHATVGEIFVKVDNGYELDELHNVNISNVQNNDILQRVGNLWVNSNVAAIRTSLSIGNVANLNLNGNVSEFLTGTGTFASVPTTTPGGGNGQIQFNVNGSFGGLPDLVYDNNKLRVGTFSGGGSIEIGNIFGGGPLLITQSEIRGYSSNSGAGGNLSFIGGATTAAGQAGGKLSFLGGSGDVPGDMYFEVGSNPGGTAGGKVEFATYGINLQLLNSGAISVNGNVGTSGQVLTSSGNSAPTWTTPSAGGGGDSISPFLLMGA